MSEKELRRNLWNYVLGKTSLDQFKDWFIPSSWTMESKAAHSVVDTVHQIKLRLAEASNGDWTEPELKNQLVSLLITASEVPATYFFESVAAADVQGKPSPNTAQSGSASSNLIRVEYADAA